ncbi:MAG: secondary thiamine-phosphate synthase enzyme YjbQ [Syntrophorhabdaceae bacterium]|nr:secondary thiamine-phosphate synthase enzyme YjbQ [Syntrophorhabdaceae bacterium]MDD4196753.1 secondary thiamine-phosphate synthase enzyme YjbQ [Syntrophorhabdaceae bacterium]HOC45222.1 secondary thiamine-phosphate synthase enzyme YjbQ [Syntrophorhabdaceae bacterium]
MPEFSIRSSKKIEAVNITGQVMNAVRGQAGKLLHVYTPHTTCGIIINEDADPDVMRDIIERFAKLAPADHPYRHREGNSDAHIKASLTGASVSIPFAGTSPTLGTWQGIFLMEFDGPRERRIIVSVI